MLFGTSKLNITPLEPLQLCGYATRTTSFEGVKEDIFVRVHAYKQEQNTAIFVYADILWWNSSFVKKARNALKPLGINPDNVIFVASHNHSGPPTGNTFISCLENPNEEYSSFLLHQVLKAINIAQGNMQPVTISRFDGLCNKNVYRRVKINGKIEMRPNYSVEADNALTILCVKNTENNIVGLIVHYACHNNLCNENYIHPDYAGIALRMLDNEYPNSTAIFLQGCTADLRPNCVLGEAFMPVGYEQATNFAQSFVENCKATLCSKGTPIQGCLKVQQSIVLLPMENLKTIPQLQQLEASSQFPENHWAKKVLEHNNTKTKELEISCVEIGDFTLLTFNAEMAQHYAQYARSVYNNCICAGYANGMIGYVCTKQQIEEGGYEPIGSALYFALSGTFSKDIEDIIHNKIKSLKDENK